jgi:hypothetical protein
LNQFVDAESLRGIEIYRNYSEIPAELKQGLRTHDLVNPKYLEPCGIAWVWTKNAW